MVTNIHEEFAECREGWTGEDKKDALAYLKTIESFEFVYTLCASKITFVLQRTSVKLQGKHQDVISGILLIELCCADLKRL